MGLIDMKSQERLLLLEGLTEALGFQEVREDLKGLRTLDPKIRVDLQCIEYGFVGSGCSNEGINALRGLVGA